MKLKYNRGFTLIELMVVVVIIAILTSIVMASFSQAKAKSRDAKRIADLAQMQLALELAFDKCGVYPPYGTVNTYHVLFLGTAINAGVCRNSSNVDYLVSDFISKVPTDPINVDPQIYRYEPYGTRYDYRLMVRLETMTGAAAGGVATGNIGQINCSGNANNYCVSPR
jgi:prepilin-type N-terminal cleavage/methylation domain-containing protein